jgi:hypothetical protein
VRKRRSRVPVEAELDIDWERWTDGRAYRLKRKRHFSDVDPALVRAAAEVAARRMGRGVVTSKDRFLPEKYVWVQFSHHMIGLNDPCPCGSRRLLRVHANFVRCPECHSLLMHGDAVDVDDEREGRSARMLRKLTDLHLQRHGQAGKRDLYRGYAREDGIPVLVWAQFRAKPLEDRIRPEDAFDRAVIVQTVSFAELTELFDAGELDVSSLWNGREPDWDLVWSEPPEPESGERADEPLD